MSSLIEKEWVGIQINNKLGTYREPPPPGSLTPTLPKLHDKYVASLTYGGATQIPPMLIMENATNGGEDSPTGAVYDLIKFMKELTQAAFELAKERGLLHGISFDDIK